MMALGTHTVTLLIFLVAYALLTGKQPILCPNSFLPNQRKTNQPSPGKMASIAMTPTFLRGAAPKHPSTTTGRQRGVVVMSKASKVSEGVSFKNEHDSGSGRRDLVFAAAAAAVWSVAKVAAADEPKPGSPEAKKKYAAVCVTMPTARVCRKGPSIN